MMKRVLSVALATLLFTSSFAQADEWYEEGTLENANGNEWHEASQENKVASAGGLLVSMYEQGLLDSRVYPDVESTDDLRPHAEKLAKYTDEGVEVIIADAPSAAVAEQRLGYLNPMVFGSMFLAEAIKEGRE